MSSDLENLYQQIILDHARRPHAYGLVDVATSQSHQVNPTCGDEVTLQLVISDGVVQGVHWEGHGCAISQASASLFSGLATGLSVAELTARIDGFREVMRSRGTLEPDEELFGDAVVLGGVSKYMARVKCAMLAWVAAEHALAEAPA